MPQTELPPLEPPVARKLDGGLRRILAMAEPDIRRHVRNNQARLARIRRRIAASSELPRIDIAAAAALATRLKPHPVWGLVKLTHSPKRPIRVRAIVHFFGNKQDLAALGVSVSSQAHDIFTIDGTPRELRNLALQPATAVMRLPRRMLPLVEDASAQAGIADVHQPRPVNPTGYRGQGIAIGLIDTPLDVRHPTFRAAANPHDSRVLYYWVQAPDSAAAPGQTPEDFNNAVFSGLNYGRLYTQADINAALANAAGTYGNGNSQISRALSATQSEHGTHTAGIAAANGHDAAYAVGAHVGAAPEATMIHVCSTATWANFADGTYEDLLADGQRQNIMAERMLKDDINGGIDELGVLLLSDHHPSLWLGSQLSIHQARTIAPHNDATSLQVVGSMMAAIEWIELNPRADIVESEALDHDFVLAYARRYWEPIVLEFRDWHPCLEYHRPRWTIDEFVEFKNQLQEA
jgi:hypothetical protein